MTNQSKRWQCDACGTIFTANDLYDDDDVGCQRCNSGDIHLLCQSEGCLAWSSCFHPSVGWCCRHHYDRAVGGKS
jgi:hypothetical protein